jgi:hypothetical protein
MLAIAACLVMWLLNLALLILAIDSWIQHKTVNPTSIWFALPALRNNMPSNVAICCAFDMSIYFWCQMLIVTGNSTGCFERVASFAWRWKIRTRLLQIVKVTPISNGSSITFNTMPLALLWPASLMLRMTSVLRWPPKAAA